MGKKKRKEEISPLFKNFWIRHCWQVAMPTHGSYKNLWHMTSRRCPAGVPGPASCLLLFIRASWPLASVVCPCGLSPLSHPSCSCPPAAHQGRRGTHHHLFIFRARHTTRSGPAVAADHQKGRKGLSLVRAARRLPSCFPRLFPCPVS